MSSPSRNKLNSNMLTAQDIAIRSAAISPITQSSGTGYYSTKVTLNSGEIVLGVTVLSFDGGTSICVPQWDQDSDRVGVYVYGAITQGTVYLRVAVGRILNR